MKDVLSTFSKKKEYLLYLLRCSYFEIYNERIFDILAPLGLVAANPVQIKGGVEATSFWRPFKGGSCSKKMSEGSMSR